MIKNLLVAAILTLLVAGCGDTVENAQGGGPPPEPGPAAGSTPDAASGQEATTAAPSLVPEGQPGGG